MAYLGRSPRHGFLEGQTHTFSGSDTSITLLRNVSSTDALDVFIDNVHQEPDVAYTLSSGGDQITFTGTPLNGQKAYIRFHGLAFDTARANALTNTPGTSTLTLADAHTLTLDLNGTTALTATTSGITIPNLTVTGTTTTVNSTQLNIGDNLITLNSDLGSGVAPSENAGIEVNRGSASDVSFLWNESNDYWQASETLVSLTQLAVLKSGTTPSLAATTLGVFKNSAANQDAAISIIANSGQSSAVNFGDENDEDVGQLSYSHTSELFDLNKGITVAGHSRVNGDFSVSAASGEDRFAILPQSAGNGSILFSGNAALTGYEPLTVDFESLALRTSGVERLAVLTSGNIGLGKDLATTTVSKIFSTGHASANRGKNAAFGLDDGAFSGMKIVNAAAANSSFNSQSIEFITHEGAVSVGTRMTINSVGNVGIGGATTIDELLHLEKSSGTTLVKTEVAANSVVGFEIQKTTATTSNWRIVDGQTVNGDLEIYDVTNSRLLASFNQSGNVKFVGSLGVNKSINAAVGLSVGADSTATNSYGLEVTNASANTRFLVNGLGDSFFYKTDNAVGMKFDSTSGRLGIGPFSGTPNSPLHVLGDLGTSVSAVVRIRGTNATARTTRLQFEDYNGTIADGLIDFVIPNAGSTSGGYLGMGFNQSAQIKMLATGAIEFGGNILASDIIAKNNQGLALQTDDGVKRLFVHDDGYVITGPVLARQSIAGLNARENGASIEFGHQNNGAGYFGTLGAFGNNGHPYIGFSCFSEASANTFTTKGHAGSLIKGDLSGNMHFMQVGQASNTGQTPVTRMQLLAGGELQILPKANSYNFKAFGFDTDSFFGVRTDNNHSVLLQVDRSDGLTVMTFNGHTGGLSIFGSLSKGSGSFKIDHPLPEKKDTHHLVHSFIEGPQADNIYRGTVDLVDGKATVDLDAVSGMTDGTFVLLNTNVQCLTSNESGWTAIKGSVSGNTLSIQAQDESCTDTISWVVIGERHDDHMKETDWTDADGKVIVEPEKVEEEAEEAADA